MATDTFSRAGQEFGGAIAADGAKIVFASEGSDDILGVGMLVQQLGLNYQQNITRVYEIGSDKTFYIAGRTQGQATLQRIMGPREVQLGFYKKFGSACNASQNNIDFRADTGCVDAQGGGLGGGAYAFTIKHAVIVNLGINIGATDMVINEQVTMMFAALNAQAT